MALPSNIKFGLVEATFIRAGADNADVDREPQVIPVEGILAEFTPDTDADIVTDAVDGYTIFLDPIYGITNAAGVLVPANPAVPTEIDSTQLGIVGIPLISPIDSAISPNNWSWNVKITTPEGLSRSFSFELTEDGGDLASLIAVTPNPGESLAEWAAIVSTVQTALNQTLEARDEAVAAAAGGGGGGADGASAYEIAVANGFVGSEAAWLASLQGEDGADAVLPANVMVGVNGAWKFWYGTQAQKALITPLAADTIYATSD